MKKIFVEGHPDLTLVRSMGFTRKNSKALGPKGEVINHVRKQTDGVALVDEDPQETPSAYLQKLKKEELGISFLRFTDVKKNNKIIALRPRLEEWIIRICTDSDISLPIDFGLPDTPKELHDVLPQRLPQLEKLIKHLLDIKNPPLIHLQSLLTEKS